MDNHTASPTVNTCCAIPRTEKAEPTPPSPAELLLDELGAAGVYVDLPEDDAQYENGGYITLDFGGGELRFHPFLPSGCWFVKGGYQDGVLTLHARTGHTRDSILSALSVDGDRIVHHFNERILTTDGTYRFPDIEDHTHFSAEPFCRPGVRNRLREKPGESPSPDSVPVEEPEESPSLPALSIEALVDTAGRLPFEPFARWGFSPISGDHEIRCAASRVLLHYAREYYVDVEAVEAAFKALANRYHSRNSIEFGLPGYARAEGIEVHPNDNIVQVVSAHGIAKTREVFREQTKRAVAGLAFRVQLQADIDPKDGYDVCALNCIQKTWIKLMSDIDLYIPVLSVRPYNVSACEDALTSARAEFDDLSDAVDSYSTDGISHCTRSLAACLNLIAGALEHCNTGRYCTYPYSD